MCLHFTWIYFKQELESARNLREDYHEELMQVSSLLSQTELELTEDQDDLIASSNKHKVKVVGSIPVCSKLVSIFFDKRLILSSQHANNSSFVFSALVQPHGRMSRETSQP